MNRQYRSSITHVLVIGSAASGLQAALARLEWKSGPRKVTCWSKSQGCHLQTATLACVVKMRF